MLYLRNILIILLLILVSSCEKNEVADNNGEVKQGINQLSRDIVIDENAYTSRIMDEFVIRNAAIANDSLQLEIEYGGGCGIVNVRLVTDGAFMESYPVQLHIALSFDDEDTCKALLLKTISTNLSNLADHYRSMYHTEHDSIILHLEGYPESLIYHF